MLQEKKLDWTEDLISQEETEAITEVKELVSIERENLVVEDYSSIDVSPIRENLASYTVVRSEGEIFLEKSTKLLATFAKYNISRSSAGAPYGNAFNKVLVYKVIRENIDLDQYCIDRTSIPIEITAMLEQLIVFTVHFTIDQLLDYLCKVDFWSEVSSLDISFTGAVCGHDTNVVDGVYTLTGNRHDRVAHDTGDKGILVKNIMEGLVVGASSEDIAGILV